MSQKVDNAENGKIEREDFGEAGRGVERRDEEECWSRKDGEVGKEG